MSNIVDMTTTEVAILLDDYVNKYHPGVQTFRLQSVVGLKENTRSLVTESVSVPNLMNEDQSNITLRNIQKSSVIKLQLPREVTRNYPYKYIPPGTRFIVSFNSGDITKPMIIGREFE